MEFKKIDKRVVCSQEVHFVSDNFSGYYMRISAEKWYDWIIEGYYLVSPQKAKELEDAFQNTNAINKV